MTRIIFVFVLILLFFSFIILNTSNLSNLVLYRIWFDFLAAFFSILQRKRNHRLHLAVTKQQRANETVWTNNSNKNKEVENKTKTFLFDFIYWNSDIVCDSIVLFFIQDFCWYYTLFFLAIVPISIHNTCNSNDSKAKNRLKRTSSNSNQTDCKLFEFLALFFCFLFLSFFLYNKCIVYSSSVFGCLNE